MKNALLQKQYELSINISIKARFKMFFNKYKPFHQCRFCISSAILQSLESTSLVPHRSIGRPQETGMCYKNFGLRILELLDDNWIYSTVTNIKT